MDKAEKVHVDLVYSQKTIKNMVKVSIDKIDRKFWIGTVGSVLAIKRLSIRGCLVEHYEIIDCKYRFHIYQFYRKDKHWKPKSIEHGAANVELKELNLLREIVNVVDIYDYLENIWLSLSLLGLNGKICFDVVGYIFDLYFRHKSYHLKIIKI